MLPGSETRHIWSDVMAGSPMIVGCRAMSQRFVEEHGNGDETSGKIDYGGSAMALCGDCSTVEIAMFIEAIVECICFDVMPTLSLLCDFGVPWFVTS